MQTLAAPKYTSTKQGTDSLLPSVTLGLNHSYNIHYCKKGVFGHTPLAFLYTKQT